jgi:ferredoxin-type protein NapH
MNRQNSRKLIVIVSMFLFPITIYYLSPQLIIIGALDGIMTGSFIVFFVLLVSSVFFGRIFCGYLCPAGGIQECASQINNRNLTLGWKNKIKYVIWLLWITGIILSFIFRKHDLTINFFYQTTNGISIANIYDYFIYYGVLFLIFIPSVVFGKRFFCHYICWIAPFMVLGTKIGNLLHIKRLRLKADKNACINCHLCNKYCPMSLNVAAKVKKEEMDDNECILCGTCIDRCPKKAISYMVK